MEVRYSKHLMVRLEMRGIPYELPRIIYDRAKRKFYDTQSNLEIAVLRTKYFSKFHDITVAYRKYQDYILLITIHPLKRHQVENRIRSGRWKQL